jgi:hypothetical protein
MSDRIFLRLNENFAVGADELQWILYRRHAAVPEGSPLLLRDWRPISFVRSTKEILLRSMREKGCKPSHEAQLALDGMPPTFEAWKLAYARPGKPPSPPEKWIFPGSAGIGGRRMNELSKIASSTAALRKAADRMWEQLGVFGTAIC